MSISQYEVTETFRDLEVRYGGKPRRVTVEFTSSGTTAAMLVRGVRWATRLILDRDTLHVLSGVFTRSLNNVRRSNKLRVNSFTSREEVRGWAVQSGSKTRQLDVVLEATASILTITVRGLARAVTAVLDPEDIRLLTWFLSKALFNVKVAQRIRS